MGRGATEYLFQISYRHLLSTDFVDYTEFIAVANGGGGKLVMGEVKDRLCGI